MSAYKGYLNSIGRKGFYQHVVEGVKQYGFYGAFRKVCILHAESLFIKT